MGSTSTSITINQSNNTLDGLRLAINNSGANVTASFLNDGSSTNPVKLIISGTKTGVDNAVSVSLTSEFLGAGTQEVVSFTQTQAAQNSTFIIDGISISKSTNVINDVIGGTTLNLLSAGSGTITLSTDQDAVKEKVTSFVDGYNDIIEFLTQELSFDVDLNTSGTLFGNFTVQNLQQTLRDTISRF